MDPDEEIATDTQCFYTFPVFFMLFCYLPMMTLLLGCGASWNICIYMDRYVGSHAGLPLVIDSWLCHSSTLRVHKSVVMATALLFIYLRRNCIGALIFHAG